MTTHDSGLKIKEVLFRLGIGFTLLLSAPSGISGERIEATSSRGDRPAMVISPFNGERRFEYVNSVDDYIDHINSHVERVVKLGLTIRRIRPEKFSGVDANLLVLFLGHHDEEKREQEFINELYPRYGQKFTTSSGERLESSQAAISNRMVERLNERGDAIAHDFFAAYNKNGRFINSGGEYTPLARLFLLIAHLADTVDRSLSPVSEEEFGRKMSLASEYLKEPELKKLALDLEKPGVYDFIVRGSTLPEYQARRRSAALADKTLATVFQSSSCLSRSLRYKLEDLLDYGVRSQLH